MNFAVEVEKGLLERWWEKMEKAERAKVRIAAITGWLYVSFAGSMCMVRPNPPRVRTSDGEGAVDVVPPGTVDAAPADED